MTATNGDAENATGVERKQASNGEYHLKTFQSSLNLLAHTLVGIVVGVSIVFAFRSGLPLGATPIHIVLCVIGVSVFNYFFVIL